MCPDIGSEVLFSILLIEQLEIPGKSLVDISRSPEFFKPITEAIHFVILFCLEQGGQRSGIICPIYLASITLIFNEQIKLSSGNVRCFQDSVADFQGGIIHRGANFDPCLLEIIAEHKGQLEGEQDGDGWEEVEVDANKEGAIHLVDQVAQLVKEAAIRPEVDLYADGRPVVVDLV